MRLSDAKENRARDLAVAISSHARICLAVGPGLAYEDYGEHAVGEEAQCKICARFPTDY